MRNKYIDNFCYLLYNASKLVFDTWHKRKEETRYEHIVSLGLWFYDVIKNVKFSMDTATLAVSSRLTTTA